MPELNYPFKEHRERILFTLEKLEEIPSLQGPKFVFAHIICPHGPMVFGPNGEFVDQSGPFTLASGLDALEGHEAMLGYRDQVAFISTRIEHILKMILNNSETEPIIILQGDTGGSLGSPIPIKARMAILNSYYLPYGGSQLLYDSISPVNTFRLIFNYYFGGEYELLKDEAYFSPIDDIYNFQFIPNEVFCLERPLTKHVIGPMYRMFCRRLHPVLCRRSCGNRKITRVRMQHRDEIGDAFEFFNGRIDPV